MDSVLTKLIQEDSVLPKNIKTFGQIPKASECNVILLTGVTGYLGPYLLMNLLKRQHLKIYCLVRQSSLQFAKRILGYMDINDDIGQRVILVPGDLSFENFGIEISQYDDLCSEVDAVIHSAVKSHHLEMYQKNIDKSSDLRAINVLGTIKILEFATTTKVKRIFYASTLLGCNRLSDTEMTLSEELIDDENNGDGLGMGYSISKFICDKLMSQAIRRGIPGFVCRFPFIVFNSQTGYMEFEGNHYFSLLMGCIETGMKPQYPSAFQAVPVDLCAKISVDLFFKDDVPSGIYNLMNPHSLDMDTLLHQISKRFQVPTLRHVDFQEFSESLVSLGPKSVMYPFKMIYFNKDAEELLAQFNLVTKLILTEKGGKYLENVSSKFRKYVPDIDELIDPPQELVLKMLQLCSDAGHFRKRMSSDC